MTKTFMRWRFKNLPTSDDICDLIDKKVITAEEARKMLFKEEDNDERDIESFKSEIEFLRKLVDSLAQKTKIVEVVKDIGVYYDKAPWYKPYYTWMNDAPNTNYTAATLYTYDGTPTTFSNIKTF